MGSKDKGKREAKKPARKIPKPTPVSKRESFSQNVVRNIKDSSEKG